MPDKLGDLMFQPEDSDYPSRANKFISIDKANQLLAERLGKAPEVFEHCDGREWHIHDDPERDKKFYRRARLVCIEPIKKEGGE